MKYGKRDGNHAEIVHALRRVPGCRVFDAGDVGGGFPDLVVGFQGQITMLEVKDGSLPPSARKLTKEEKKFHDVWSALPVYVVTDITEALEAIGIDTTAKVPF